MTAKDDDSQPIPPAEPAPNEIAIEDPEFAAACRAKVLGLMQGPYERLCTAIVTRSERWGRLWRADVEHSEPTALPYICRYVIWLSPEGPMHIAVHILETALFPEQMTPPTTEQVAADAARTEQRQKLAAKIREMLMAEWPPFAALERARPGMADHWSESLASRVMTPAIREHLPGFLSFMARKYLGSEVDEREIRSVAEKISKLYTPQPPSPELPPAQSTSRT